MGKERTTMPAADETTRHAGRCWGWTALMALMVVKAMIESGLLVAVSGED